jgi:hypothetical protein
MARGGVLVALDTTDVAVAKGWARATHGAVAGIKLGLEFFQRGPAVAGAACFISSISSSTTFPTPSPVPCARGAAEADDPQPLPPAAYDARCAGCRARGRRKMGSRR